MSTKTKTARGRKPQAERQIPAFRAVQLATLVDQVPKGDAWLHEMKYDGYRCLLAIGGGETRAYTRSGLDWSNHFPGITKVASSARDCSI